MISLNSSIIQSGTDARLPRPQHLRAGPLSLLYDSGDLRYIKFGDEEIIRRIYVAVRDHNWDTIPAHLSDVQIETADDSFEIVYTAHHRAHPVDFIRQMRIRGHNDGAIDFAMDGVAQRAFRRNRIGFCVLHPMQCAGRRAVVEHTDGTWEEARFPEEIAPQLAVDGTIRPVYPFADMRALAHELSAGGMARIAFRGEVFELEDQRNWTDASYKIYGTPLNLPFPVEIPAGTRVTQSVSLSLEDLSTQSGASTPRVIETVRGGDPAVDVAIDCLAPSPLPQIGLGTASHGQPLSEQELARLRALRLHHLRVDLPLADVAACRERLHGATTDARRLGVMLDVVLILSGGPLDGEAERELQQIRTLLDEIRPPVARWLIFHQEEKCTAAHWVDLARTHLTDYAPAARFGAGSNAYFAEINRARPDIRHLDFLTYSINPQVHAFDHLSLVETPPAQAATVASARTFAGGKGIVVSPVTLLPRFNPNATGPEPDPGPHDLPPQVDVRQMSLLGAAWTLASLKHLLGSGVEAVTYYETTGWRGVMETAAGSPLPARFPSVAGGVFPMYHVLADVGEFSAGNLLTATSGDPLRVEALALARDQSVRVLLANMTPDRASVSVVGLPDSVVARRLDGANAEWAMRDPETFRRGTGNGMHPLNGRLELDLPPFGLVRLDSQTPQELSAG